MFGVKITKQLLVTGFDSFSWRLKESTHIPCYISDGCLEQFVLFSGQLMQSFAIGADFPQYELVVTFNTVQCMTQKET
jgi:hypothetical protein